MGALNILAKAGKTAAKSDEALPLMLGRATPKTQAEIDAMATRVARQMNEEHVRSGKPKDTTNLAGRSMKESQRLRGLDYVVEPTGAAKPSVIYQPKKGDVNVAIPGDQTISDSILRRIGDIEGINSIQEGGARYGLGKLHMEEPLFWASGENPAQMVQNKVNRVADFYGPERVVGQHLAMGPVSNNFAMHFADANLRAIDYSKMKPQQMQQFDRLIANGYYKKNAKTGEVEHINFPEWPGIADPEGALVAMRQNPELRKWFNDRMKTPKVTQPLGLPDGRDIQWAITEPELRNMEVNLTGLSAGEMVPGASLTDTAAHRTYDKGIRGTALGHQEVLTPFTLSFPDAAQHIASTQRPQDFTGTIQKVFPHQIVDEQYLDEMGRYRDLIKKYTGKKKGGLTLKASGGLIKAQLKALREEFAAKDAVIKAQQAIDEKKYLKDIEANTLTPENIQKKVEETKPQKFDEGGAAFGKFPQMSLKRRKQDPEAAKNVPVDLVRGAISGVLGAPGDVESLVRMLPGFDEKTILPTSEDIEKRLPFKSDTPVSRAATGAGQIAGGFYTGPGSPFKLIGVLPAAVKHGAEEFAKASAMGAPHVVAPVKKSLKSGPFYSSLDEAAEALARGKGTGKEFMTELRKQPGVKKAEIDDRGLAEIEAMPKMTKAEFLDALNSKPAPQISEKVLSDANVPEDVRSLAYTMLYDSARNSVRTNNPGMRAELIEEKAQKLGDKWVKEGTEMPYFLEAAAKEIGVPLEKTAYKDYATPGGENYREILLKLPSASGGKQWTIRAGDAGNQQWEKTFKSETEFNDYVQGLKNEGIPYKVKQSGVDTPAYQSRHWDDPNVLAHIRVSDRTGPNGEKILHVEEIQSDWHQAGRKQGYGPKTQRTVEAYYETKDGQRIPIGFGKTKEEAEASIDVGWKNLVDIKYETFDKKIGEGVPDAPFKKNWHELAMKKIMDMAAEGGYDKVAITPGREQADRYNLSKYIKSIQAQPVDNGEGYIMKIVDKDGNVVSNHRYEANELPDQVGKEMADKIISSGGGKFEGLDLQVGGEGMKGFYDQILPAFINKEYGKYGAQVDTMPITTKTMKLRDPHTMQLHEKPIAEVNLHSIDITPEMREHIKHKGQPMYQAIGAGTAGLAAEDFELPDGHKVGGVITSLRRNRNKTESVKNRFAA